MNRFGTLGGHGFARWRDAGACTPVMAERQEPEHREAERRPAEHLLLAELSASRPLRSLPTPNLAGRKLAGWARLRAGPIGEAPGGGGGPPPTGLAGRSWELSGARPGCDLNAGRQPRDCWLPLRRVTLG